MGMPTTTAKAKNRKVLVKAVTGPIRATGGSKVTFKVLECTVDGKTSNGSDIDTEEAKQIKWTIKEAASRPSGNSFKLVIGQELSTGTGKSFDYTIPAGMVGKAVVAMAYVNVLSPHVAQWVKISTTDNFKPSNAIHLALTTTFPEITDKDQLDEDFKKQWDAFQAALVAAGATVTINSTLRSLGRAYMMHYCVLVASGQLKPWEVPDGIQSVGEDTGPMGVEWSHTLANGRVDEAKSKSGALAMKMAFDIAYPASLTSNHVKGKAIDVLIEWNGTLKIKEKGTTKDGKAVDGKEHEIKSSPQHGGKTGQPAGNKELRDVAATYGIHKLLSDAPHWSVDGK